MTFTDPVDLSQPEGTIPLPALEQLRAGLFVRLCFEARTVAHILHFALPSHSKHKAFNDFYDAIVPAVDAYAEAFIGRHGQIKNYTLISMPLDSPVEFFKACRNWIDGCRSSLGQESELQSLIDDVVNEFNSLLFKLENLQ